ncbi:MAG: hypothetical protein IKO55_07025 [Kiritimatiellae bacterium]|nr:hypothetical protein [Kiritimatiellia bacterium]
MRSLAIWFAKRYALSLVQDAVKAKSGDVAKWATRIAVWIERMGLVVRFLASLADKLADGELTSEEGKAAVAEANALAIEFTKEG